MSEHSTTGLCPMVLFNEGNVLFNDTLNTFFIYGYMVSDIWLRTILIVRKETRCRHIGYSYRLTARVLLYAPSHRQDNTYHGLCYTSRGALAGTRNSSMALPLSYVPLLVLFNEGNVLFNDAHSTFYLQLNGVRHMVKDQSYSERGNPLPPYGLLFTISSKEYFISTIPQTAFGLCYTSCGALFGM